MELNLQIWQTLTHTSLVLKMLNLMLQANMILWNMLDGRKSLDALLLFLFWLCACNIYNLHEHGTQTCYFVANLAAMVMVCNNFYLSALNFSALVNLSRFCKISTTIE